LQNKSSHEDQTKRDRSLLLSSVRLLSFYRLERAVIRQIVNIPWQMPRRTSARIGWLLQFLIPVPVYTQNNQRKARLELIYYH
jgi:hypothetical protein